MKAALKQLAISRQGLTGDHFAAGKLGTLQAIEHLGYVQIDTIAVVERAHHHVLWNRVEDYQPEYLNMLIKEKQIFEHWYHAAAYLPMRDYRFALPLMHAVKCGEHRYIKNADPKLMQEILVRIKIEGQLRLRDIDNKKTGDSAWWNRGPGRRALEQLFMQGDIMISERNGMEKVFDLTERCIADNLNLTMPSIEEYALYLFETTLRAHGVFTWKQLIHLKTGNKIRHCLREIIDDHLQRGVITQHQDTRGQMFFISQHDIVQPSISSAVKILSPFDNLVIHRERLQSLFDFDYKIECYVPAAKRVYGYFALPILYGNNLVARMDCKAHRAKQQLELLTLHLEDQFKMDLLFTDELTREIHSFAAFNQCQVMQSSLDKIFPELTHRST